MMLCLSSRLIDDVFILILVLKALNFHCKELLFVIIQFKLFFLLLAHPLHQVDRLVKCVELLQIQIFHVFGSTRL
jgi:hypothetical protein